MRWGVGAVLVTLAVVAVEGQTRRPDDPNLTRAREHYSVGWEHMRSEAFERAAAEFQLATDFDPNFAMAWYGLGRAHMALRRYQQAALNLEQSRNLFTAEVSRRFVTRMDADRARRDRVMELEDIRNQYLKGPQTNQSREMLRLVENQLRYTNDTIEREIGADFSNTVPAFVSLSLGSAYFRIERFADAERAYRDAIRSDGSAGAAHNNLAVLYLIQGRLAESADQMRAAERAGLTIDPELKAQLLSGQR
jgi:tetratricopeptide (TPR) repeat protein